MPKATLFAEDNNPDIETKDTAIIEREGTNESDDKVKQSYHNNRLKMSLEEDKIGKSKFYS